MITAGDFRKGVTIEVDNNVFIIVDFLHVKPGKGAAFVRTKLKNVMTGAVLERTFNPSEKYALAHIERKEMQYLYEDGGIYYFMDNETYDQLPLNKEQVESALPYLKDNSNVTIKFFKGNAFSVEPENFGGCRARRSRRYRYKYHKAGHSGNRICLRGAAVCKCG